jgi:hypothetical protein
MVGQQGGVKPRAAPKPIKDSPQRRNMAQILRSNNPCLHVLLLSSNNNCRVVWPDCRFDTPFHIIATQLNRSSPFMSHALRHVCKTQNHLPSTEGCPSTTRLLQVPWNLNALDWQNARNGDYPSCKPASAPVLLSSFG